MLVLRDDPKSQTELRKTKEGYARTRRNGLAMVGQDVMSQLSPALRP
jgi:hypothetical protein